MKLREAIPFLLNGHEIRINTWCYQTGTVIFHNGFLKRCFENEIYAPFYINIDLVYRAQWEVVEKKEANSIKLIENKKIQTHTSFIEKINDQIETYARGYIPISSADYVELLRLVKQIVGDKK